MQYLVVVEKGDSSWGAHVPDLPGCIATAESRDEVLALIKEAIEFHIEGLREAGEPVPSPQSEPQPIPAMPMRMERAAIASAGSSKRTDRSFSSMWGCSVW